MRKSWMLRRGVESDIGQGRRAKWENNFEGLDRPIQILVIDSVFIMPHSRIWSCHLVTNPKNAVIPWIRFTLVYSCAGPSHDGRLFPHGGAKGTKIEIRGATTHTLLLVGDIVIHVALTRVSLAPGVFVGDHVLCFGKIGSALILRRDQVARFNQNSVRRYVMTVAAVVVRCKT